MRKLEVKCLKADPDGTPGRYVADPERSALLTGAINRIAFNPRVYQHAADLIEDGGLAKDYLALGVSGRSVDLTSPLAKSFCVMGAVCRAGYDLGLVPGDVSLEPMHLWTTLVEPVTKALGIPQSANFWNNRSDTTAEDVVQALRGAQVERVAEAFERGD